MSLDSWSFNGSDLGFSGLVSVVLPSGLGAMSAWRGDDVPYAGLPGRRWMHKLPDSRRVGLSLQLIDAPANILSANGILDKCAQLFSVETQAALVHTLADASTRTAQAQVATWSPAPDSAVGNRYLGVVDFELADPYFYGVQVTPSQGIAASPTSFNITNAGTQPNYRLVVTFTGPIANPRLTNQTNGWYVEVDVTVASGQSLVVDCGAFTALNNGVTCIGSVVHSGGSPFLRLEPGINAMQATGTGLGVGSAVSVAYQPAFLL